MKTVFSFLILCFCSLHFCLSQDGEKVLLAPADWRYEKLDLPLSFAPEIPLTGVEEVYFAPGWDTPEAEDFWTYAFAWILEKPMTFDKTTFEAYLTQYYNGLMKAVGGGDAVTTQVTLVPTDNGYEGEVDTLDAFFTKERVHLYLTIEKFPNLHIWLFRLSPENPKHKNWAVLDQVQIRE